MSNTRGQAPSRSRPTFANAINFSTALDSGIAEFDALHVVVANAGILPTSPSPPRLVNTETDRSRHGQRGLYTPRMHPCIQSARRVPDAVGPIFVHHLS